jgi:hypothetical protein
MPEQETVRVQDAIRLIKAGKKDEAHDVVAQLLKETLDNAAAWAVLAHLAYKPDAPQETIYCLRQVLRLQPGDMQARQYLEQLGASLDKPGQWHAPPPEFPPLLPVTDDTLFASWYTDPTIEVEAPEIKPRARRRRRSPRSGLGRLILVNAGAALAVLVAFYAISTLFFKTLSLIRQGQVARAAVPTTTAPLPEGDAPPAIPASVPDRVTDAQITPAPASLDAPFATAIPQPVDYQPMIRALEKYLTETVYDWGYDVGVGFVDIQTGQVISINGDTRYHSMSTFKGPLAAYYLWLLEHGSEEHPGDQDRLRRMLQYSSNVDTTCIFQRVGGIASFNDWLYAQGLSRQNNFVFKWQDWPCEENGVRYIPPPDRRYSQGDEALGLPGDSALLTCPSEFVPCDKAFAPVELAWFYARLYRGEILNAEHTALLLDWLTPRRGTSIFLDSLPRQAAAQVYVKGGTYQANEEYRVNFVGEAGIIETADGAYTLAVFMQRNPEWPGTEPLAEVVGLTYRHFTEAHLSIP